MATNHVYKTPDGEDTEWDIIQRRLGNYAPKEPKWEPDPFEPKVEKSRNGKEYIDEQDAEGLDDLEDDFADDRFLEEYRQKRLQEMQKRMGAKEFGSVISIGRSDFVSEVTNAGEGIKVVVILFRPRHDWSDKLLACMEELAVQFPRSKFVRIIAAECIKGYPDHSVPTVLLYENTNCKETLVGVRRYGGEDMTPDSVAAELLRIGAIEANSKPQGRPDSKPQFAALSSDDEDSDF